MRRFVPAPLVLSLLFLSALTVVPTQAAQAQTYKVIYNFTGGGDGAYPEAGVTIDKGGNLYGTTFGGGECCRARRSGLSPNKMSFDRHSCFTDLTQRSA